ncbi:MAG: sulfite exporter TauE/SafE family protein [Limisphaerales bacterium]
MELETWQLVLLSALGIVAGILNVVAGGGSLLTLPVMVLMGLPGPVANGTNRVAILAQNATAVAGFRKKGFSDFKLSLTLSLCALPGGIAGAYVGTLVRGKLFNSILAVIMILILVQMIWKERSKKTATENKETQQPPRLLLGHLCIIAVGFYGGFIQAGVGFLLMAVLHNVMRLDLVRVNMHKVFVVGVYTAAALVVFVMTGNVLWIPGIALAIGNSIGGWIGSHLSVKKGEPFIRKVLYLALGAMAVKLLIG